MNEPQWAAAPIVGELLCQVNSPRSLLGISEIDVGVTIDARRRATAIDACEERGCEGPKAVCSFLTQNL
jgi:hypothetical protein